MGEDRLRHRQRREQRTHRHENGARALSQPGEYPGVRFERMIITLSQRPEPWARDHTKRPGDSTILHECRNLDDVCPLHARPELQRDYHSIIYAADGLTARAAYDAVVKKWTTLCPPVVRPLEEAGTDLLTFYSFPKAMWKSLRTTNALENHREFRRRTKTQASFRWDPLESTCRHASLSIL